VGKVRIFWVHRSRSIPQVLGGPGREEAWLEVPLGEWTVWCYLAPQDGRPAIGELCVRPSEAPRPTHWTWLDAPPVAPRGGIASKHLRQLRTGVLEDAREIIENWIDQNGDELIHRFALDPGAATDVIPRRHRISDRALAEVAQVYADADQRGEPPREAVAKQRQCSPDYASKLIRRARDRGFLTGGEERGRRGGQLTDKSRQVLKTAYFAD
jgi:hypothetical protein